MYKIALTGGIGTGKTYLSCHFIRMGIPVFYADDEAKKSYQDHDFCEQIRYLFGSSVMMAGGKVNLGKLAQKVFKDEVELAKLNNLVHPFVMQQFEQWSITQNKPTVMMESAIIFEANLMHYFDEIIVADAPLELRVRRIMARNPEWTREDIRQRMARQIPQDEKCRRADLVICTGDTYRDSHVD